MSNVTTPSQLTGLFKQVYGSDIENLIPENSKLVKMIPFSERDRLGAEYNQPVVLSTEQGVTYAADGAGAFDLGDAIAMGMKEAKVTGSQMLLRSAMSYDAAYRASGSEKAFVKSTELLVDNMLESITKRLEISLLHGQAGIAHVAEADFVNDGGGVGHFTVTADSWATGIFAGSEGALLTFIADFDASDISSTTNIDPNTAGTNVKITSVDVDNRIVYVSASDAVLTSIETASGDADLDVFYKYTVSGTGESFQLVEMAGLTKIIKNTGTLFNINAGQYNLWKGNTVDAGGEQLTMSTVLSAVGKAVQRGLNEKVVVLVNPDTWADLASDLAALRRFDGSYTKSKGENGFESLKYYGQSGEIEIVSHNIAKAGQAVIFPPKRVKRIGAQDVTFDSAMGNDQIFLQMPNNAGFELRVYTSQSVFVETPARCVIIENIVNSI